MPGSIALISDAIGFISIYLIEIRVIQEMAITASPGVAVIILINLFLLPLLLFHVSPPAALKDLLQRRVQRLLLFWAFLGRCASHKPAAVIIVVALRCVALRCCCCWRATDIKIGDLHRGVPELRADSRYNIDTEVITSKFTI